jgi:uncharacterized membrane protein
MTLYQGLLYAHVVAAIVWVGGGSMLHLVAYRARLRGPEGMLAFGADMEWIGQRVLTPAALVVLVCGIGMVVDVWSLRDQWVIAALTMYAIAFGTAMTFFGSESARAKEAMQAGRYAEAEAHIDRLTLAGRIELGLLYLIVFDMFFKPQFSDLGIVGWGLGGFAVWTAFFVARSLVPRRTALEAVAI